MKHHSINLAALLSLPLLLPAWAADGPPALASDPALPGHPPPLPSFAAKEGDGVKESSLQARAGEVSYDDVAPGATGANESLTATVTIDTSAAAKINRNQLKS